MKNLLFFLGGSLLLVLTQACTSVNDSSSVNSQLPWNKPAAWENERVITANDLSYSNHDGNSHKKKRETR